LTQQQQQELQDIAHRMLQPKKGILAADETNDGIGPKLNSVGLENSPENRRVYRDLIFTTAGISQYISGVILYDETYNQSSNTGERFVDLLRKQDIVVGVQVDLGLAHLNGSCNEFTARGLDSLEERAETYKKGGCDFAKWRCAYNITDTTPSQLAIKENAHVLAKYASICQSKGLVPIVEPDISCAGEHTIERCQEVSEQVLVQTYKALHEHNVFLEGTILKTNMVIPGFSNKNQVSFEQIGRATFAALQRSVPAAVLGVGFLSGGLSEMNATQYLNAVNQVANAYSKNGLSGKPWRLTFCYGRALLTSLTDAWQGKPENAVAAQKAFLQRAKANAEAEQGEYKE